MFLRYPEALRSSFPRLKEKLEDPDPGVQSAAVNVICELARKNPKNYLSLAPTFFKLMTSSTNNWMLIKIIKLFGALTPLEPRLGKKLIEPLTNLIHSTSAMSLLYECINTVIAVLISISSGMPNHSAAIQLCVQKLRILIEDSDQNLKYLGLLAMSKILKTNPKSVQGHKDLIMQCLDDSDDSIRLRALDLLYGMVSKKNLMEIVKKLMVHMDRAEGTTYRDELMHKTIQLCSQNDYQYITNFEWYVSVLVELAQIDGSKHCLLIASQMMDVTIRVESIRSFSVKQMSILLENHHLLQRGCSSDVLYAAAWICGEFPEHLPDPESSIRALCRPKILLLPAHVQSVYIQNAMKLYSHVLARNPENQLFEMVQEAMKSFMSSSDLEVQERASVMHQYIKYINKYLQKGDLGPETLDIFFSGDLNPVAQKAQKKVPVPEGLDLDAWINEPPEESEPGEDSENDEFDHEVFVKSSKEKPQFEKKYEPSENELKQFREARIQQQESNPNYLKSRLQNNVVSLEQIPVKSVGEFGDVPSLVIPGLATADQFFSENQVKKSKKRKRKKEKKRKSGENKEESVENHDEEVEVHVSKLSEMPEGAEPSDGEDDDDLSDEDGHKALRNITFDEPEKLIVNGTNEKSKKKKEKESGKKKPKKSKQREKSKVEPKSELLIPDTNDVDFWLGDSVKEESKSSDEIAAVENGSAGSSLKRGKKSLIDGDIAQLSCTVSCVDEGFAVARFVIENKDRASSMSDFKIELVEDTDVSVIEIEEDKKKFAASTLEKSGERAAYSIKLKVT